MKWQPDFERPIRQIGTPSPADLGRMTHASQARWARAAHQHAIARFCATVAREWSNPGRRQKVAEAMREGFLPPGPLYSPERIRLLVQRWDAGERSVENYLDGRRRSGRRPNELHPALAAILDEVARLETRESAETVRYLMEARAAALVAAEPGAPAPWVPSVSKIKRLLSKRLIERSAGRHGPAAAEIDVVPSSTVPTDGVYDVGTLDEFTLPIWVRYWDDVSGQHRSFRPELVILEDNYSRATVAWAIPDPTTRRDPATGRKLTSKESGFTRDDVLGTLLGTAFPEFATTSTRPFVGFTFHTLRWDRAKAHLALAEDLQAIGIHVPDLPGDRPPNRGVVERLGGTLKRWLSRVVGFEERYEPTDQRRADGEAEQLKTGRKYRRPTRTLVDPQDLLSVAELREEVERIVRRYNFQHRHRMIGRRTPHDVFMSALPRRGSKARMAMRSGRDLVALLPVETTKVVKAGVEVRSEIYAAEIDGMLLLAGTPVTYRADPFERGLVVDYRDGMVVLPRKDAWARGRSGAQVAEQQRGAVEARLPEVQQARRESDARALGLAALKRGEIEGRAALERHRRRAGSSAAGRAGRGEGELDEGWSGDATETELGHQHGGEEDSSGGREATAGHPASSAGTAEQDAPAPHEEPGASPAAGETISAAPVTFSPDAFSFDALLPERIAPPPTPGAAAPAPRAQEG